MSDFLTRLAQRALGQAPLVKPVIRPMYAPAGPTFMPGEEGWPEVGEERERPRQGRSAAGPEQGGRQRATVATTPRGQTVDAPDEVAPAPRQAHVPPADPPASAPDRAVPSEPTPNPPAVPIATLTGTVHPSRARPADDEVPNDRQVPTPLALRQSAQGTLGARRALAWDASARRPDEPPRGVPSEPTALVPEVPFTSAGTKPPIGDDRSRPPAARPPFDTQSTAPTIRVTIGHIDIRAAPPPSAPPPARPKRPALSLSDYLKARDGGGR